MKIKVLILNLLFLSLLISCKRADVSFGETQPQNVKEIKAFPNKIIGIYYNSENNAEIQISEYFIFKKIKIEDTLKTSELHNYEVIENNNLINLKTKEKYKIRKINDTLFSGYVYSDTIFEISKKNVLKKFKGYFFLNKLVEETGFWEVEKLYLSNGILRLNGIETENELELLQNITETKKDTLKPFRINPTKKQFKEFIKKNGFTNGEIYLKK
ncbi:hypothetical protein [Flavobacterium crassostreae]|uniref:Lipoprotein n=1 Tax=Flavobacterium crassostreae TaxID=1763534 RepID=A0A1B9DH17_9FLAO|nr:hypothetical protein [Flavobacterium crassostreae]OCB69004.1 hypothetical protein LPBF_12575 [Flavobacterium crassostreae]